MVALAKGLALLALIGPALAIGLIGKSAMEALAFAELLGLLAFLSLFLLTA